MRALELPPTMIVRIALSAQKDAPLMELYLFVMADATPSAVLQEVHGQDRHFITTLAAL